MTDEIDLAELLRGAHAYVVHPGDVVLLQTKQHLSAKDAAAIRERLAAAKNEYVIVTSTWSATVRPREGASS